MTISALIITYNEEHNIAEVIKSLDFVAEIIVVDSYSSDQTVAIASEFKNVKVVQHPFENYAIQRNYAMSLAHNPWILFLDADERITSELKKEIVRTVDSKNPFSGYYFYRTFMYKNKKIHFCGSQTDKVLRLFKKEKAYFTLEKIVHEKLIIPGKTAKLKNKLIHYTYRNYSDYKQKMVFYGKLKAKEEVRMGTKTNFFHYYIRPLYHFLNKYIFRLGFLDGKKGIVICYLRALSVYARFQELKKLNAKN